MKTILASSIAVIAALLNACSPETSSSVAATAGDVSHAPVTVLRSSAADDFYEAVGSIQSRRKVTLSSKIAGDVVALHVKEGDVVRSGQLLVEIDHRDPSSRVRQSKAGLREAQTASDEVEFAIRAGESALTAAETNLRLATSTLDRFSMLRDRNSVTPHEFEEVESRQQAAKAEADRARASLDALRARRAQIHARIEQAQAEVETSSIGLSNTQVRAPLDGVVTAKFTEAGAQASPGTPLLAIEMRDYEIDVAVPESQSMSLRRGTRVFVDIPSVALNGAVATITTIVPTVDSSTRSYNVKLDLPALDKSARVETGMFARVRIPAGMRPMLAIPDSAVVERGQLTGVFVVDESNIIRLRLIKTGEQRDRLVEVLSGLAAGDRAILVPDSTVKDGATWKP